MKRGRKPVLQERIRSLADGTRTAKQIAEQAPADLRYVYRVATDLALPLRPERIEGHYPIREALEAYADGLNDGGEVARQALKILCRESRL